MGARTVLQSDAREMPRAWAEQAEDLSGAAQQTRLRLTRRGRIVFGGLVTVLAAGLLALIATFAAPNAFASVAASGEQQFHYVVMQPDASLWSLATDLDPEADPRDLIAEIVQLNQLEGSSVEAGQAIAVPLRYSDSAAVFTEEPSAAQ